MSDPTLSAYVQRCHDAMAEYQRLRFLGMSHDAARKLSGFEEAVMGKSVPVQRDVKVAQAGKDE
jgi:hypothetical protein